MRIRHVFGPALLLLLAVSFLAADTPCPPSTPWPPAAGPIVKTVPWVVPTPPFCLITPHDTISGRAIHLKATTDSSATQFYWDFGDGTSTSWTAVSDPYNIGVIHTYTGSVNTSFVSTVHVKDAAGNTNTGKYFVTIRDNVLNSRVNIAIDQALWRLHREMRSRVGSGANMYAYWNGGAYTGSGYVGNNAVNTTAFLVNGHKPDPDPNNPDPYAETAQRGLNITVNALAATAVPSSVTNARGTFNPDGNNNGYRIYVPESDMYEGGMVMDMLVATGLPDTIAALGAANVMGATYKNIVQDMMDTYTYCQGVSVGNYNGGWRYGCRYGTSDNSVCQWAAIGMLAAHDGTGFLLDYPRPIPDTGGTSPVLLANMDWLNYSFNSAGVFGYTDPCCNAWGWNAVTPSGMVQLAMTGQGRGAPGNPTKWDRTENWIRVNFSGPLGYYYGLFSFTKSMLLYPGGTEHQLCARDGFPSNNLTNCIDWYSDPSLGVATNLVNNQNADGYWWCHEYTTEQCYFETAWATIMLNRTVFASGLPVAVIDASPTSVINGGTVSFTGKNSIHQDSTKSIVAWEWDFSGTGAGPFTVSGVNQNNVVIHTDSLTFPATFIVRLRVTDNATPTPQTAITSMAIVITNPPFPPTANAGGPYSICPQAAYRPFYLNGTGSRDGTNGGHLPGNPPNMITEYAWDLLGNGNFQTYGPTQSQPRVDDFYEAQGLLGSGSTVLVGLRVTDNSALSYGTATNLTANATAAVVLRSTNDQLCTKCVNTAQAIPHGAVPGKPGYIQLVWIETGAHHYNVYRGTMNGGPYTLIGTVVNPFVGTGKSLGFTDNGPLTLGVVYYYRVAPATLADIETCQSNQANASGTLPRGR